MIIEISKWLVTIFGLFIILAGVVMLFNPLKALKTLRKFASTNFINYTEISLRLLVGITLILYDDLCRFPGVFKVFGWFMAVTALILYCVPRKLHHKFSVRSADIIKPIYFRFISPFAFLLGGFILYNVHWIGLT